MDHSTVLHGKARIARLMQTDEKIRNDVASIRAAILSDWENGRDRAAVPDLSERDLEACGEQAGPQQGVPILD